MSEQAFVSLSPPLVLLLSFPFSLSPSSPPSFRLSRVILLHRQRETEPETETGIPGYGASVKLGIRFKELLQPRHREGASERERKPQSYSDHSPQNSACVRQYACARACTQAALLGRQHAHLGAAGLQVRRAVPWLQGPTSLASQYVRRAPPAGAKCTNQHLRAPVRAYLRPMGRASEGDAS